METINWKVEGMSCATCALTIGKYLEKKGGRNVKVSLASGDVSFDLNGDQDSGQLREGIHELGYNVMTERDGKAVSRRRMNRHLRYFLFCLPSGILLGLPMVPGIPGRQCTYSCSPGCNSPSPCRRILPASPSLAAAPGRAFGTG